jgi:integrase
MQGYRFVFPDPYKKAGGEIVNRFRFKRPGYPSSTTTAAPGCAEFDSWYHALNASTANADPVPVKRGKVTLQAGDTGKGKTLDWLLAVYYGSPQFENLGARARALGATPLNQQQRRRYLDAFAEARTRGGRRFGGSPFEDFKRTDIELYLDKVKPVGRSKGNLGRRGGKSVRDAHLSAIRKLFNFAIDRELTKQRNAAGRIKGIYKGKGNGAWNADDIAKFRARWPHGTMARLAFELALAFGLRRSDLIRLGDHMVGGDGVLRTTEVKGSGSESNDSPDKPIEIDLNDYPELRALIKTTAKAHAEATGVVNFKGGAWLANGKNRAFGYGDFGKWWRIWQRAAGVDREKVLHGVRAGFAVEMLKATGGDLAAVSDALGHTNLTTTQVYLGGRDKVASASRGRLALRDATKGKGVA